MSTDTNKEIDIGSPDTEVSAKKYSVLIRI